MRYNLPSRLPLRFGPPHRSRRSRIPLLLTRRPYSYELYGAPTFYSLYDDR